MLGVPQTKPEEAARYIVTSEDAKQGTYCAHFLSGTSAFEATVVATSCIVNIFRIKSKQFDSKRTCPR